MTSLEPLIQCAVEKYVGLKVEHDLRLNVELIFICDEIEGELLFHPLQFCATCSWEDSLRDLIDTSYPTETCVIKKVMLKRVNEDGSERGWIKATQPAVLIKTAEANAKENSKQADTFLKVYLKTAQQSSTKS